MKNKDSWQPSKFIYRKGKLIASRDAQEVKIGSRLIDAVMDMVPPSRCGVNPNSWMSDPLLPCPISVTIEASGRRGAAVRYFGNRARFHSHPDPIGSVQ